MRVAFTFATFLSACGAAVMFSGSALGATSITDLGTLGGTTSYAFDVNIHGDVVGTSLTSTGATRAFLYRNGMMSDLGVLDATNNYSQAFGINDAGSVVGISTKDGSDIGSRPFLYSGGAMSFVGSYRWNFHKGEWYGPCLCKGVWFDD
jgi:probable HAF family extracellular repeat protein